MNRILSPLLLIGLFLVSTGLLQAQTALADNLYRLDRSTIKARITDVSSTDVFYTDLTASSAPRKIRKADLWKIVYSDGTEDVFNSPKSGSTAGVAAPPVMVARTESAPAATRPGARPASPVRQETIVSRPASRGTGPQSIIKYAPLSSIGYEHVLANNHSIYGGLSLYNFGIVSAIGLKAEYRFYGLAKSSPKRAPEGLWVAPTVLLWRVSATDFQETESVFVTQLGGIAGYQWLFNNKISLEPALGLSLTAVGSDSDSIFGAGVVPLFALRVGYVIK